MNAPRLGATSGPDSYRLPSRANTLPELETSPLVQTTASPIQAKTSSVPADYSFWLNDRSALSAFGAMLYNPANISRSKLLSTGRASFSQNAFSYDVLWSDFFAISDAIASFFVDLIKADLLALTRSNPSNTHAGP